MSEENSKTELPWMAKEKELLQKIKVLEAMNERMSSEHSNQLKSLQSELVCALERKENRNDSEEIRKLKAKHDDLLTKAKELLFEKTKTNKQQELQIEALKNQVTQLKEVVQLTKDMLELRNTESKHLNERFETIDLRLKSEKERHSLLEKKIELSKKMYNDLKQEYNIQSELFKVS